MLIVEVYQKLYICDRFKSEGGVMIKLYENNKEEEGSDIILSCRLCC